MIQGYVKQPRTLAAPIGWTSQDRVRLDSIHAWSHSTTGQRNSTPHRKRVSSIQKFLIHTLHQTSFGFQHLRWDRYDSPRANRSEVMISRKTCTTYLAPSIIFGRARGMAAPLLLLCLVGSGGDGVDSRPSGQWQVWIAQRPVKLACGPCELT